ncbi:MAG: sulfatase-like hydrolase/transferase [Candidatus Sulfotelmatobacter sp.]
MNIAERACQSIGFLEATKRAVGGCHSQSCTLTSGLPRHSPGLMVARAVHGEKNTSWEGGYRVPAVVRWPGVIKPGTVINDACSHEDWLSTRLEVAGET